MIEFDVQAMALILQYYQSWNKEERWSTRLGRRHIEEELIQHLSIPSDEKAPP